MEDRSVDQSARVIYIYTIDDDASSVIGMLTLYCTYRC